MQSVGKAGNVFRRMPPPASLPSLRAENNGQDPTTPVVPQGGTGWSKSDNPNGAVETPQTPTTQPVAVPPPPPPANDLRPSWLVAANAEQQANNSQAREFPSLAPPLTDSDKINKWDPSFSSFADKFDEMSNRNDFEGDVPIRFLGPNSTSSDAAFNAKTVAAKPISSSKYNRISDDEGFDSQDRDRNYSPEEGCWSSNGSPSQTDSYGPDKDTDIDYRSYMRESLPQYRTNEIRILRRATEQLLLQDISDDEDEVQMTRLDKPSVCVVKRGGETKSLDTPESERSEQGLETITRSPTPPPPVLKTVEKKEKRIRKEPKSFKKEIKDPRNHYDDSNESKPVENVWEMKKGKGSNEMKDKKKNVETKDAVKEKKQTIPPPNPGPAPAPAPITSESPPPSEKPQVEEMLPAPLPQENVWAKRKEERESLEREKEKSLMPRVMQQAIEQHFPKVHDSATIKVNKESTRKSSDTEFTRAAIRARKQATSNDVRRLMNTENGPKIKLHRHGNQDHDDQDAKTHKGQNGYHNGFKGHGVNRNNQTNGRLSENNHRERKDSHRSNVSSHHSEDNKKPVNGQNKKNDNKAKENGESKKFNIEDMKDVNIESWADEMENLDGFEEVKSKNKKNKVAEKQPPAKHQQNHNQEVEKNGKAKPKDPKQGTRLFVPKALRKETDDLPANGLLSPQSVETKEKIAAAKSNGDVPKKPDDDSKGYWDSLTPEVSTLPKKVNPPPKKKGEVEFPKPVGKFVDITGYDFTFDPQLHQTPIMSDRAAIQKMLSAENEATDDGSNNRRKFLTDLRQSIDGMGQFAMSAKAIQEYNDLLTVRSNSNNNNVTLAPFSNHYSSFQPLFTDAPHYPNPAPSPPMSYLNMINFSNLKRQNGYGSPENGLLGRMPNQQAAAVAAVAAAQHQRIWNGGHFDINSLVGTPPANYSSNGSYGFFNNGPNANEMNKSLCLQHRPPFSGLPNGLSGGQTPFFDRTTLPPANLAVGSQRQNYNSNMNRPQQPPPSGQAHSMNGMNNSSFPPPPQSFPQPPPPMMRMQPTNGGSHQDNVAFFFGAGNRGPAGRPQGISAPPPPGHSAQFDMWSNSNSNYFGNAGHSTGNWNGTQAAGPPRQNGYNPRQVHDNQQMNNRMRPTPIQGTRQ
uniref:BAT2_N domain-containing protein n=1 Tax=Caenorhabditis tropicalis TaxID=1561998 RepID=A0A1I7U055_9PELO